MATSKTEKQREKNIAKHGAECPRTVGQIQTVQQTHNGNTEGKGEKQKKIFEVIMSESFPKLMRYAKPDPGNSENTK